MAVLYCSCELHFPSYFSRPQAPVVMPRGLVLSVLGILAANIANFLQFLYLSSRNTGVFVQLLQIFDQLALAAPALWLPIGAADLGTLRSWAKEKAPRGGSW